MMKPANQLCRRKNKSRRQTLIKMKVKPDKGKTSKRQSAAEAVPNLGQNEAEMQRASEAQLKRMTRSRTTSAPGRFIAWCKQEQASIQQQLELMETGKVLTGENRGSGWVDTTAESIERARSRLEELESLLTESGLATVSKPNG
jgi:hypothetical protein